MMLNKLSSDFSPISCYVYGNLCSPKSEVRKPKTEVRSPKMKNQKPKSEVRSPNISFSDINRTEPKKITENRKTENRTVWTSKNRTVRFSVRFCPITEPNRGLLTPNQSSNGKEVLQEIFFQKYQIFIIF